MPDRNRSSIIKTIIICLVAVNGLLYAQNNPPKLTLDQLIDSTLQNSNLLQSVQTQKMIKKTEFDLLKANYLPKISTSVNSAYYKSLPANKEKIIGKSNTDVFSDITVNQTVYDWNRTEVKNEIIEQELLVTEDLKNQITNNLVWGVSDAFYDNLKTTLAIKIRQNSIEQLKSRLQYVENYFNIGKASNLDILKIKIQLAKEARNLEKEHNIAQLKYHRLKKLGNIADKTEFVVFNDSVCHDSLQQISNLGYDTLLNKAFSNSSNLAMVDSKIKLEYKQKELTGLQNRPEIYSFLQTNWEDAYIPFYDNFNWNIGLGVKYTLPIWGGSGINERMQQSDLRVSQLQSDKNNYIRELTNDIKTVVNEINSKKNELSITKELLDLANETLSNATIKYQSEQGTIIDVLDAQNILTETRIGYEDIRLNCCQLYAKLNALTYQNNLHR